MFVKGVHDGFLEEGFGFQEPEFSTNPANTVLPQHHIMAKWYVCTPSTCHDIEVELGKSLYMYFDNRIARSATRSQIRKQTNNGKQAMINLYHW